MRIVLTGATGQLGQAFMRDSRAQQRDVCGLTRSDLDLYSADAIDRVMDELSPDVLINAAAYTAVDQAEREPAAAFAINANAAGQLAHAANRNNCIMIQISTDYVFDGQNTEAWRSDSPIAPLGVYGQSKAAGESQVAAHLRQHLILRLSWIFGEYGHNFVKTIFNRAISDQPLKVVSDQQGCPSYTGHIVDALWLMLDQVPEQQHYGVFHYCDAPATSWHGFAEAIVERAVAQGLAQPQAITAVSSAQFPTPARRPANSVLNCTRLEREYQVKRQDWSAGLDRVINHLAQSMQHDD